MCDIVSGIMSSISALSVVAGTAGKMIGQAQETSALKDEAKQTVQAQANAMAQEGLKQQQERQAMSQDALNLKKENMIEASKAAAGAESEGTAYDMLMNDYKRADASNNSVIEQQQAMQDLQHKIALKNYTDEARNRLKQIKYNMPTVVGTALDYVSAGLSIGSGIFDGYTNHQKLTNQRSKKTKVVK